MLYTITISGASFTGNAAPNDGFFETSLQIVNFPTTREKAIAKARGWRRYKLLILNLGDLGGLVNYSAVPTGVTADNPPSSITITVSISNPPKTADELNAGQFLTGVAAVERAIARAMVVTEPVRALEFFDPTTVVIQNNGNPVNIQKGITLENQSVGPLAASLAAAEAAITVTAS